MACQQLELSPLSICYVKDKERCNMHAGAHIFPVNVTICLEDGGMLPFEIKLFWFFFSSISPLPSSFAPRQLALPVCLILITGSPCRIKHANRNVHIGPETPWKLVKVANQDDALSRVPPLLCFSNSPSISHVFTADPSDSRGIRALLHILTLP